MSRDGPGELDPPPEIDPHGQLYPPEDWRFEDQAGPPWQEEVEDVERFESVPIEDRPTLDDEAADRAIEVAFEDGEVRELLGNHRYETIGAGFEPTRREKAAEPAPGYLVVVYDYDEDRVVEAHLDDSFEVVEVETARYQPAATAAEREQAVELAREDERLAERLDGDLVGRTMVVPEPDSGRRRVDVRFVRPDRRLPEYHATVDLSTETVETVGSVGRDRDDGEDGDDEGDGGGGLGALLRLLFAILRRLDVTGRLGSTDDASRGDSRG